MRGDIERLREVFLLSKFSFEHRTAFIFYKGEMSSTAFRHQRSGQLTIFILDLFSCIAYRQPIYVYVLFAALTASASNFNSVASSSALLRRSCVYEVSIWRQPTIALSG